MLSWIERLFEMSKFKVFLAFWTGLSCCALVYLANRSFKPELSPPKEFISNLNVTRLNSKDIILVRNAWPQILKDLNELRGLFQVLNITKSFQPIELKFSSKNPELFKIGPDSVELGISFALSPGQISHALLQNWYLQNRSVQSNSEKLQQLLFADIFWTAAHASFELGLPDLQNALRLTNIDFENLRQENILAQIASSDLVLASDWAPQDMQNQYISQKRDLLRSPGLINPLSLRKNLLVRFLKFEQSLGLSKRIEYLKTLSSFRLNQDDVKSDFLTLSQLTGFIKVFSSDFGVQKEQIHFNFILDGLFTSDANLNSPPPNSMSYVVQVEQNFVLFPGQVKLTAAEVRSLNIHTVVISVQNLADLKSIEKVNFKCKKILAIENQGQELVRFESLESQDFDRFAKANRMIRFALFDQESLAFAHKRNLDHSLLSVLSQKKFNPHKLAVNSKLDMLGITNANWNPRTQTYHTSGAVEALQVWRPSIRE